MSGRQINLDSAERLLADIPGAIEKAASLAFNRAVMQGRTAATREATAKYTAKAKTIRPTFKMKKASKNRLDAALISAGDAIPLKEFSVKPSTDTTGKNRKQLSVSVRKDTGSKAFNRAFISAKKGGNVFEREGKSRLPIKKLYGPAVPSMLGNAEVSEEVQDFMAEVAAKRLDHEVKRILEKGK